MADSGTAGKATDPQEWIRQQRQAIAGRASVEAADRVERVRRAGEARDKKRALVKAFAPAAEYINALVDAGVRVEGKGLTPTVDVYEAVPGDLRRLGEEDSDCRITFVQTKGAGTQWERVQAWGFGLRAVWEQKWREPERLVFQYYDFGSHGEVVRVESESLEDPLERFLYDLGKVTVEVGGEDVADRGI